MNDGGHGPGHARMTFADFDRLAERDRKTVVSFTRGELLERISRLTIRLDPNILKLIHEILFSHPRKNQKDLTGTERETFNSALQSAMADGSYATLAAIHADMSHNMHGFMGFTGAMRFLPWHRVYLYMLEQTLQMYAPNVRIPYWDWANDHTLPSWVYLPPGITRGPDTSYTLPTQADINATVLSQSAYIGFTQALEGYHNTVHMWVGGNTMPHPNVSPRDPIFWLHHANVDRIWNQWQASHPGLMAPLSGADAVMDPWPQTVADAEDTYTFYYYYA